jgi:photosystem II stability/assembly factor-like uncharacterized protein
MKFPTLAACSLVLLGSSFGQPAPVASPAPVEADFVKETGFTYGPWRSSVIGSGGYVQNVVPCPSNPQRFYTYVDVGGVSRSDDGGKSWRMLHGALPPGYAHMEVRGLVVDPRDADRIVVATGSHYGAGGGLFLSTDAGATFKKVLQARYAGNGGSRSAGFIIARDAQNPDRIITGSVGDGVFLSSDNGVTWSLTGAKDLYPTDIRFDRANPNRIWLCTSGEKWKEEKFTRGFHRSDDGGATWRQLGTTDTPSEIIQDPKNSGELFGIFDSASIKKSTDGGETWIPFSEGLPYEAPEPGKGKPSISDSTFRAIAAGPDFILTGNTRDTQFFKLKSGASRWEKIEDRQAPAVGDWFHKGGWYFGGAMGSITVDPHDPAHWFITDYFAIYQTFDAGKTWRLTIDGMETTVAHCVQQDPSDPGVVHVGVADVGAFTSVTGGVRFKRDSVPHEGPDRDGGNNMKCMDVSPKLQSRVYGVANRNYYTQWRTDMVYVSVDRGTTWRRTPMSGLPDLAKNPATTIVADLNDPYVVYLTVSGRIRNADGSGGSGGVYKSTDGGASWEPLSNGLPSGEYCFPFEIWAHGRQLAVDSTGALVALNGNGNRVYRFDPAAKKWETTSLRAKGGKLWSVVADRLKPGCFFVGVRGDGIYRTEDAGLTWKRIYEQSASFVATDGAVAGRVAAGTNEGVILSTDGGDTWTMLDQRLPYRHDNIPGFSGERLVVASAGNGAFWMPLSPAGEKPVQARAFTPPAPLTSAKPLPVLKNATFDSGNFADWSLVPTTGSAVLERDTANKRQGSSSLKISISESFNGTLQQDFAVTRRLFTLAGFTRSQGALKNVRVSIESFDAAGQSLGVLVVNGFRLGGSSWGEFYQTFALPRTAARARLAVRFEGTGTLWLDNFRISDLAPIFPE